MASTRTTASRPSGRGAVGRSEANGKPRTVTVRKLKLELPPTVPLRVLKELADIGEAGQEARLSDMVHALELVIGEEQMERVWNLDVDTGNGTMDALQDLFADVIDKVFDACGLAPGESPASP